MLNDILQPAVIAILLIVIIGQLLARQGLENKLTASKKREKPLVYISVTYLEGGNPRFIICRIEKTEFLSPAGWTSEIKDAQRFLTRGLAETFARNMNCIVEKLY